MSQLKILSICLLFAISISMTSGLKCYHCKYIEGITNDFGCSDTPNDDALIEITDDQVTRITATGDILTSFFTNSQVHEIVNNSSSVLDGTLNATDNIFPYKFCMKLSGKLRDKKNFYTRHGKSYHTEIYYVSRGAVGGVFVDSYSNDCVNFGEIFEIHDVKACFCNTDGCNTSNVLKYGVFILVFGVLMGIV